MGFGRLLTRRPMWYQRCFQKGKHSAPTSRPHQLAPLMVPNLCLTFAPTLRASHLGRASWPHLRSQPRVSSRADLMAPWVWRAPPLGSTRLACSPHLPTLSIFACMDSIGPTSGSHLQVPPLGPTSSHLHVPLPGPTSRSHLWVPPPGPTSEPPGCKYFGQYFG